MTYGLDTGPLPEGWTPVEVVAVVKCLGEDGEAAGAMRLSTRATNTLTLWEAVGMLDCARRDLLDQYGESLEG